MDGGNLRPVDPDTHAELRGMLQASLCADPAVSPLLQAGNTLATVAEPNKDLISYASEIDEVARELDRIARSTRRAHDAAEEAYDRIADRRDYVRANETRDTAFADAKVAALRSVKRALIDLARIVCEMEG